MLNQNVLGCEELDFSSTWIRETPPNARSAAGYLDIHNPGDIPKEITEVSSACCNHTMIHRTEVENGKSRMVHLEGLVVPAGETVSLSPLGTHLMLMGLADPMRSGESKQITFKCTTGNSKTVEFAVIRPR